MAIDNGDFVRVNFTGKIKETDEVFDTTYDEIAQEAGIFDENKTYKPIPIVVGGNHLLPSIEEAIIGLEAGERKTIEVESDDAFGPRDPKAVQLIPMKEFKRQGMTPYPGMRISAEGGEGRILTVNGGRVKVYFNHPLAGKDLVYDGTKVITDYTQRAKTDQSLKGIKSTKNYKLADEIIRNTYRTLLSRGQKGCYIYCEDKKLTEYIKRMLGVQ